MASIQITVTNSDGVTHTNSIHVASFERLDFYRKIAIIRYDLYKDTSMRDTDMDDTIICRVGLVVAESDFDRYFSETALENTSIVDNLYAFSLTVDPTADNSNYADFPYNYSADGTLI